MSAVEVEMGRTSSSELSYSRRSPSRDFDVDMVWRAVVPQKCLSLCYLIGGVLELTDASTRL